MGAAITDLDQALDAHEAAVSEAMWLTCGLRKPLAELRLLFAEAALLRQREHYNNALEAAHARGEL